MIIHDVDQKSEEWFAIRAGKLTASCASKLITPTGKLSTQYKGEISRIIAEKLGLQDPEEPVRETYWMAQGVELEGEARSWLEVMWGRPVFQTGFITSDDGVLGVSPDGYIYELGDQGPELVPIEIKCPKPSTHIKWVLDGGLPEEHRAQVHFAMVVTGAPYAWFMSYNPNLEPLLIKVERDEFTAALEAYTETYKTDLTNALNKFTGEPQ
jgi:hypothetical protein